MWKRRVKWGKTINEMVGNISGENFLGCNFPGASFSWGSLMGGNFWGGNFPAGGGEFSSLNKIRLSTKRYIF